jgi:CheY-like chemotaxis protein
MVGQLGYRVVVVEDEPLIRKLLSGYLVAAGYVVRTAVDGLDAIAKLRVALPDLLISDLAMPRMSGFELLEVMRQRFPQIPVIVISGTAADEIPEGVAADAYYHKNELAFDRLLQTVSDLTRKPPLRTAAPHIASQPVRARWDGNGHYVVGCEDCLRSFRVPRNPNARRAQELTVCVHCGRAIQFLTGEGNPARPKVG